MMIETWIHSIFEGSKERTIYFKRVFWINKGGFMPDIFRELYYDSAILSDF